MENRRDFIKKGLGLTALGMLTVAAPSVAINNFLQTEGFTLPQSSRS
jgi:hypothetical protein